MVGQANPVTINCPALYHKMHQNVASKTSDNPGIMQEYILNVTHTHTQISTFRDQFRIASSPTDVFFGYEKQENP